MKRIQAGNIDEYIAAFPNDVQKKLKEIRATIRKAAPQAEETISYAIPTFKLHGNLVYFAAYKSHIGFYPAPRGNEVFKKALSAYEGGKGTVPSASFGFDNQNCKIQGEGKSGKSEKEIKTIARNRNLGAQLGVNPGDLISQNLYLNFICQNRNYYIWGYPK